ncbi:acyl-CoA dehydrogenase family protein [Mesobacterium sp. TK19101]|uniref:Acyl-CoA dehydrogenase family protein n=1 Tax=Mesobacterium hydrothermale TaxID=3111907 RepID=A0ABU6HEJ2_9RHOB|nr:acyl-CoA dehydrogenase family protein [Mesobacterium sp. TK19101]MEC3860532.1 acyl-CoA dehydrogenase family protein [Mesobacterium sp. TK19101]
MKPFQAPLDDILFCMDVAGASDLPDWDAELAGEIAGHFAAFAEGEIAPLDEPGDIQGCTLENGRVRMPDGFVDFYKSYAEAGWPSLTAPEEFGGQGLSPMVLAYVSEIFSGANQSLQMVTGLVPGAIRTLLRFGTDDQKARLLPPLVSGDWLATMCLTEPGAGSDLARIRTKAVEGPDGWRISGEKIFISGGDQDMSAGIFHLVLARTSDNGLKGLSLFACTMDQAGDSIRVVRIEEKMGLHASPTCQMVFDDAPGELIGGEGQGLAAMFTMMNHARADVALQGVAHSARAHDVARAYAEERVQGRKTDGSPARLIDHADVQRMLDRIDMLAMGGRMIAHLAFVTMEKGDNRDFVDLLTPVAKVFCTEAGMEAATLGMQVLGGYGYLREYRLEQTYRDVRIAAIYEGANAIHERVLATRLLKSGSAAAFKAFLDAEGAGEMRVLWEQAESRLLAMQDASALAHDFMVLTQLALLQALWGRMLARADAHPDPARIRRLAQTALRDGPIFARARADRLAAMA